MVAARKPLHSSVSAYCPCVRTTPIGDPHRRRDRRAGCKRTHLFQSPATSPLQGAGLLFYAFDVLIYRGRSLVELPLSTRREVLSEIFKERGSGAAPLGISEAMDATPTDLVRVAKEFGFEGIVAERKDSLYESGKRTGAWVKYKVNRGRSW